MSIDHPYKGPHQPIYEPMEKIHFDLSHISSQSNVAVYAPRPLEEYGIEELIILLQERPNDSFLHATAFKRILGLDPRNALAAFPRLSLDHDMVQGLFLAAALIRSDWQDIVALIPKEQWTALAMASPLNYLNVLLQNDHAAHQRWIKYFKANITEHTPVPVQDSTTLPLFTHCSTPAVRMTIQQAARTLPLPDTEETMTNMAVFTAAMHKLYGIGAIFGQEMRHEASLSPWALQRNWTLDTSVECGRNHYRLSGPQTSYGRGIELDRARVSCAMEIVERFSAYANIKDDVIISCAQDYPLIRGTVDELRTLGKNPLDPSTLRLEAPYAGQPLYWMQAHMENGETATTAYVPVQCVFLFCNLDEPDLFSGLNSTGLASGTTLDQAKVSALLEVIERDSHATHIFDPARCFRITSDEPVLSALLKEYIDKGIELQFQDITGKMDIPCYRCYVIGPEGQIITGTAAHLDGPRALIAAMTETPYPFPHGPRSQRDPRELPVLKVEDLPSHSTGSSAGDRALLETLLNGNGLRIYYADITCRRLGFPVVRAIIPGLEIMTDFDEFSRVSPRLYAHYLEVTGRG